MRKQTFTVMALAAVATLAIAGCSSNNSTEPTSSPTPTPTPTLTSAAPSPTAANLRKLGEASTFGGVASLTPYKVLYPYTNVAEYTETPAGTTWAVADVKICALDVGDKKLTVNLSDWSVVDSQDRSWTQYGSVGAGQPKEPALNNDVNMTHKGLPSNTCRRGWLSFQVAKGAKLETLEFYNGSGSGSVKWPVN